MWEDTVTNTAVEVIRAFDDYQDPPTIEETKLTPEEYKAAKWERLISSKIMMNRGPSWGGSKGNW